jgi:AraC-like DNA-binding protein
MKSKKRMISRAAPIHFRKLEAYDVSNGSDHVAVRESLQFMAQNYTQPIKLIDVVSASGMSRRGFMKAFNRRVGCTPGSFLRQARIEFAKRLLIEQDFPLKTIASMIGFRSENTFCIAFNRATGMAPKKFQRQAWLWAYRATGPRPLFNSSRTTQKKSIPVNRTSR